MKREQHSHTKMVKITQPLCGETTSTSVQKILEKIEMYDQE
jgi:hypothetical protein